MASKPPLLTYAYFVADPPDLPVRRADDPGGPDYVTTAVVTAERERGVVLTGTTQAGEPVNIAVTIVAPGIVHVLLEGDSPDPNRVTFS